MFHYKEGWYFERLPNGSVKISREPQDRVINPPMVTILEIDADSWPSIVASMSVSGENAHTFQTAQKLHNEGNIKGPMPDRG